VIETLCAFYSSWPYNSWYRLSWDWLYQAFSGTGRTNLGAQSSGKKNPASKCYRRQVVEWKELLQCLIKKKVSDLRDFLLKYPRASRDGPGSAVELCCLCVTRRHSEGGQKGQRRYDDMILGKEHFQSKYVQLVILLHTSKAFLEDRTSLVINTTQGIDKSQHRAF
jgi:hypothetical protein